MKLRRFEERQKRQALFKLDNEDGFEEEEEEEEMTDESEEDGAEEEEEVLEGEEEEEKALEGEEEKEEEEEESNQVSGNYVIFLLGQDKGKRKLDLNKSIRSMFNCIRGFRSRDEHS